MFVKTKRNRPGWWHVTANPAAGDGVKARWPLLAGLVFDPQRAAILLIWVSKVSLHSAHSNGGRKGDDLGGCGVVI
jgi:hypothetical protein